MDASAAVMAPAPLRTLRVGRAVYPVDLPRLTDARLHSSFVVLTIHVLGQVAFGFRVSVPQILSAILASALVEVAVTAHRHQRIVWPASAILTGSGVGLILRVDGMRAWDHWTWHGWYLYAGTAVLSLATKYVFRVRGLQVFNPSNVGLLVVFLALGSRRVEPLDLWWFHWGVPMAIAYAAIVIGGLLITHRLALLGMAVAFWTTLGLGSVVLASSGHCITTNWSARPVCDGAFTRLLLTSPEILVFAFFMLTDPKTAPRTPLRRVVFGSSVGLLSVLLFAPARTEFTTKVSLFGALAVVCIVRAAATTFALRPVSARLRMPRRFFASDVGGIAVGLSVPLVLGMTALAITQLGIPARTAFANVEAVTLPEPRKVAPGVVAARAPRVTSVDPLVLEIDPRLTTTTQRIALATALMLGLAVEEAAVRAQRPELLTAVDHGARLAELRAHIEKHGDATHYEFSDARLVAVRSGGQGGLLVGFEAIGTATTGTTTTGTATTPGTSATAATTSVTKIFGMRAYHTDRWLIVDAWDPKDVEIIR